MMHTGKSAHCRPDTYKLLKLTNHYLVIAMANTKL